ncbi:hypothetical protein BpHYR1_045927 [Brachionus plicatilis]|uniref:Uncharacterized protein n=1 Tax=Brachionus plicatilis TaxID=10195 RepID=A0A3M7P8L3_BRAPC|nr:hypothetical protein BpHYR1_045927 [Brachionus plicatilis]
MNNLNYLIVLLLKTKLRIQRTLKCLIEGLDEKVNFTFSIMLYQLITALSIPFSFIPNDLVFVVQYLIMIRAARTWNLNFSDINLNWPTTIATSVGNRTNGQKFFKPRTRPPRRTVIKADGHFGGQAGGQKFGPLSWPAKT